MPKLNDHRLTPSFVRTAGPGDHPDVDVRGLTLRVSSKGTRSWSLRYRPDPGAPQKRHGLGDADLISLEEARRMARSFLAALDRGDDPAEEKAKKKAAPTIETLTAKWLETIVVRPATLVSYRHHARRWVALWGSRKAASITTDDVRLFYRALEEEGLAVGTRRLAILACSAFFTWAVDGDRVPKNPVKGFTCEKGPARERLLSAEERGRFWGLMEEVEKTGEVAQGLIDALRLLAYTGCRKEEIRGLTWSQIDLEHGFMRLERTKKGQSIRPLLPQCVDYLRSVLARRPSLSPLVCLSVNHGPVMSLDQTWILLRKRIGLEDVRIHDLRHALASDAAAVGVPLQVIGVFLGHRSATSTERYAHLASEQLKEAARRIGERVAPQSSADVIAIKKHSA